MNSTANLPADAFRARALLLAARLELRSWPNEEILARMPLTVHVPGGGAAVLFRYGVAVLFGASTEAEQALRDRLAPLMAHPYQTAEVEELEVRVDATRAEGLQEGVLVVQAGSAEQLQLIADVLSKSAMLGHYETRLAGDFDRIEPLALRLEREGRIGGGIREHLKRIGALLLIEHRMVGRAEIGDKPELLWDHPTLERLYALLEAEFEVSERLAAIERKLDLVARTVRTLVDLINTKHALRVEWYIVVLIMADILLTLYGMWAR
ncbi:MAG TPA: RMD1 family protein [Burkholderiales bacterium]|jgi:uncharacterized Rmd1/YagE family protein|nr:RMD1 family protein [Burkholderiales bacterium]